MQQTGFALQEIQCVLIRLFRLMQINLYSIATVPRLLNFDSMRCRLMIDVTWTSKMTTRIIAATWRTSSTPSNAVHYTDTYEIQRIIRLQQLSLKSSRSYHY